MTEKQIKQINEILAFAKEQIQDLFRGDMLSKTETKYLEKMANNIASLSETINK